MPYTLTQVQQLIRDLYGSKDGARGIEGTFMWFMEEIGELSAALRSGTKEETAFEFADVLAWLVTLANICDIDLDKALATKYGAGCPVAMQRPVHAPKLRNREPSIG